MFWLTKRLRGKNYIALFVVSVQSLKILKHQKTLVCSIICREIENEDVKVFKEEESVKILKILGYNWKYIITLENMSQEFRLKNIDRTRNHFLEEIEQNELISRKHKRVCTTLNYVGHFLILASAVTEYISISTFASLLGISIGITNSAIGLKICRIAAGIKKYKSMIKKKKEAW